MANNLTPEQLQQFTSYLTPETLNQIYGGLAEPNLPGGFRPNLGYEWDSMEAQVSGGPGRATLTGFSGPIGADDMYNAYSPTGEFLGRYKAEDDSLRALLPIALAVGGQFLFGGGLGGAGASAAGALGPAELAIAAGEGILPITAAEAATAGLTSSQLAALGSGIGLSGSGLLSNLPAFLKDPKNLATLAQLGLGAASLGGASNMFGAGNAEVGSIPTQGMPVNTPEYYQAVQGFLNQYLPSAMPNQAEYLASWYSGGIPTSVGGLMQPTVLKPPVKLIPTSVGGLMQPTVLKPPVKLIPGLTEGQSERYAQLTPEQQTQYLALSRAYNAPGDAASDAALVRDYMRSSGLDINAIADLAGVDPQMVTSYLGQEGLTPAQLAQYQSLGYGGQNIYKDLVGAYQAPGTVQEDAQQVLQVMQENKLTPADLAIITGIPEKEINAYLAQATPETPSMMAGPIEVDTTPSAPTFTTQDIVNAYQQSVGSGTMSEAQFVQQAMNMGVSPSELLAAQSVLLGR